MGFSTDTTTDTVPLKGWQRARLIFDCVPFVAFLIITAVLFTLFKESFKGNSAVILPLFIGLVLLVTGFQAVQRIRDLLSGTAQVQTDVLERSWRSGGSRGRATYYGRFETLGRIRMVAHAHFQSHNGMRYRVVYSPISRIIWTLDELP